MSIKILGGTFKGIPIKAPSGTSTRPTLSMVRESVFNMSQNKIEEALFLDIFAGTGAMGLEALSRGALHSTFIEKDRKALSCLKENIEKLAIKDKATILPIDVLAALKKLTGPFSIIYIDPPYGEKKEELHSQKLLISILQTLDDPRLVEANGWVFVEFSIYSDLDFKKISLKHLCYDHSRDFSRTSLHLFKMSPNTLTAT